MRLQSMKRGIETCYCSLMVPTEDREFDKLLSQQTEPHVTHARKYYFTRKDGSAKDSILKTVGG